MSFASPGSAPAQPPIDVVLIATLRPDILRLTLESFSRGLLAGTPVRLIVNIDPIGEPGVTAQDILALCRAYFAQVVARTPESPSFPSAVQWCWSQVQTDEFFHLEDDWCLRRSVPLGELRALFAADPSLVSVRLNLLGNRRARHDGRYLVSGRLSLNPSVFRTAYIREQLACFDLGADPEKQFKGREATPGWPNPVFAYWGKATDPAWVIDTGRCWRRTLGLIKQTDGGGMAWHCRARSRLYHAWARLNSRAFMGWWWRRYAPSRQGTARVLNGPRPAHRPPPGSWQPPAGEGNPRH